MDFKSFIINVPDFPTKGIQFKDITPLIHNAAAFQAAVNTLSDFAASCKADYIAAPEARGFIFGCPIATNLGLGFIPIRKPGKLPRDVFYAHYDLEYGSQSKLSVHRDAIKKGDRIVIIDDLLATGGTSQACVNLIEQLGGVVVGLGFLIELTSLNGRSCVLSKAPVKSLIKFDR